MSLYKAHNLEYSEDFGIREGNLITLYEGGSIPVTKKLGLSPVVRINTLWLDRNIKVKCHIAATIEEKIAGLTKYPSLGDEEGLFFPYPGGDKVAFHQGGVRYSLDIMFLKNNMIVDIVENTKIGSTEIWSCNDCDVVLEVNGCFCALNGIVPGDRVAYCSVSETDVSEVAQEVLHASALTTFADLV